MTNFLPKAPSDAFLVGPHSVLTRNGITYNDRSGQECYWVTDFTGFDSADLALNANPNVQEDGELPDPGFHGGRTMTMSGYIRAGDYLRFIAMARELLDSMLSLAESDLTIGLAPQDIVATNLVAKPGFDIDSIDSDELGWVAVSQNASPLTGVRVNNDRGGFAWRSSALSTGLPTYVGVRQRVVPPSDFTQAQAVIAGLNYSAGVNGRLIDTPGTEADCTLNIWVEWWRSNGTMISEGSIASISLASTALGTWNRVDGVATAPANAAFAVLSGKIVSTVSGSQLMADFDEFIMVHSDTVVEYFDGESSGSQWVGTQFESQSNLYGAYFRQRPVTIKCRPADKPVVDTKITEADLHGVIKRQFTVAFRASDPTYKGLTRRHYSIVPETTSLLGRIYPRTYDLVYTHTLDPSGNPTIGANVSIVHNSGNYDAKPIFRFNGGMSGIVLTNAENGHKIILKDPIAVGSFIEIDIDAGTIIDEFGNNKASTFDTSSDWMKIQGTRDIITGDVTTGDNELQLSVTTFSGTPSVDVWFYDTSI